MLLCKACNTRFAEGPSACPSCGRRDFKKFGSAPSRPARPEPLPLARRLENEPDDLTTEMTEAAKESHVELDEVDVLAGAVDPSAADELKSDVAASRGMREPGPAVFHLSAAQVRTLVAEQPELIEPGLSIHTDESGRPMGVDYRTPVGAIDLLAHDEAGGLVVVMVPDVRDVDAMMPQVLGRVGYVRKHLAAGTPVRGVVVVEEIPEAMAYAAAGVSDTIAFKAYRVALTFHDLKF